MSDRKCKIELEKKRQNIFQIECLLVGITPKSFLWELSRPILLVPSLRRRLNFCDGYIHIKAWHSIGAWKASYPTRRVRSVSGCSNNVRAQHMFPLPARWGSLKVRFLLLLLVLLLLLLLLRVYPLPARRCFGQHWARSRHAASARSSLQPPDVMEIACARHIIHNASSESSGPRLDPALSRAPNPFAISGCSGRTHTKKISDRMPKNLADRISVKLYVQ